MKNSKVLLYILLPALAGLPAAASNCCNAAHGDERPNFVFFILDDMYPEMFNCLPEGEGKNLTPNIDRLAREGVVMENQYVVSPVCTPSRFNVLTGRYASRAVNQRFLVRTKKEEGQTVVQWNTFITPGDNSLPRYLQQSGYKTGLVGKNHVVEVEDYKQFPDYWGDPRDPANKALLEENYEHTRQSILACGFDFAESLYFDNPRFIGLGQLAVQNMDWIAQSGLNFIDQYHDDPFFLYFATTIPHSPSEPAKSWQADPHSTALGFLDEAPNVLPGRETLTPRLREAGIKQHNKELVLWLDDAIGAVLDRLEKHGVLDNTVIFFFNDHGQRAKGHLYEGGVHNPSIIWRSKGFGCSHRNTARIQNIDFAPTILDMAGVAYPEDTFDGMSFMQVLDGEVEESRDALFFELGYARAVIKNKYKYLAVRFPGYAENMTAAEREKLLNDYNRDRVHKRMRIVNEDPMAPFSHLDILPGGRVAEHESYGRTEHYADPDQLYDLESDPGELINLAGNPAYADVLAGMKAELQGFLQDLPGGFGELKTEKSTSLPFSE